MPLLTSLNITHPHLSTAIGIEGSAFRSQETHGLSQALSKVEPEPILTTEDLFVADSKAVCAKLESTGIRLSVSEINNYKVSVAGQLCKQFFSNCENHQLGNCVHENNRNNEEKTMDIPSHWRQLQKFNIVV